MTLLFGLVSSALICLWPQTAAVAVRQWHPVATRRIRFYARPWARRRRRREEKRRERERGENRLLFLPNLVPPLFPAAFAVSVVFLSPAHHFDVVHVPVLHVEGEHRLCHSAVRHAKSEGEKGVHGAVKGQLPSTTAGSRHDGQRPPAAPRAPCLAAAAARCGRCRVLADACVARRGSRELFSCT